MTDIIEECARAVMLADGCGYTINGLHVLCNDRLAEGLVDGYGKPLRQTECSCERAEMAVLKVPSLRAGIGLGMLAEIEDAEERRAIKVADR